MRRIVFVDDDQHVLDGLKDLLRRHRKRWEMHFANDAKTAMEWMADKPFDVVVSDMRMPGIDGAALLAHVKTHYASTARIILSGQADRESVLRALPAAHQILSKPCDPERLLVVIERACQLQNLLSDPAIRDIVGRLDCLPSAPQTYWELTMAAARPEAGLDEIAHIIERDPAISLKVLQLASSPYFGAAHSVTSLQQAVTRLGVELLKALTLSIHAFGAVNAAPVAGFSVEGLQRHSLLVARLAQELAPSPALAAEAFASALIHDVGQLVLAQGVPDRFAEVLAAQMSSPRPLFEIEQATLGVTHAQVGAYLLASWGLPLTMIETVAYHHIPSMVSDSTGGVLEAVHIAEALMDEQSCQPDVQAPVCKLDLEYLEQSRHLDELPRWRALAAKLHAEVG